MSCLTFNANVKTALICNRYKEYDIDDFSVMFKIAFSFAKKGFTTYMITKYLDKPILGIQQYLSHPEIFQRIILRYPESFQEIIQWCQEINNLQKKPLVILIFLDHFTKADDFEILNLCGALINTLVNLGSCEKTKEFYLLATVTLPIGIYLPMLQTLFNFSWFYIIINSYLSLKPFITEDDQSNIECLIRVESLSTFANVKKMFIGYPFKTC